MKKKIIVFTLALAFVAHIIPSTALAYGGGGGGIPGIIGIVNSAQIVAQQAANQGQVLGAAAFRFTRTLLAGTKGEDVTELQKILIAKGFLKAEPSGYFGTQTVAAVKAYQKEKGLEQVGTIGPKTLAALNQEGAVSTTGAGTLVLTKTASQIEQERIITTIQERVNEIREKLQAFIASR